VSKLHLKHQQQQEVIKKELSKLLLAQSAQTPSQTQTQGLTAQIQPTGGHGFKYTGGINPDAGLPVHRVSSTGVMTGHNTTDTTPAVSGTFIQYIFVVV